MIRLVLAGSLEEDPAFLNATSTRLLSSSQGPLRETLRRLRYRMY